MYLKISKPINNNIVTALDGAGQEVIVFGTGIGFKAKEGVIIPPDRVQKTYRMSNQNSTDRLKELFASLPREYIELTDQILHHAKQVLGNRLHENAIITLADHINFAVHRYRQGMNFQNVLLAEIRRFYSREYAIGKYALELMQEKLGITMPDDEAASIALHIFNAEYDISVSGAFQATKLLDRILVMVVEKTGYTIDEQDYCCERFISHLRYLTQCVIKSEPLPQRDDELYSILVRHYPLEARCGDAIKEHIQAEFGYTLPPEEVAGLIIHIRRIGTQNAQLGKEQ